LSNGHTIRIGLIGTGNIGKIHLTGLASLKQSGLLDIEVSAICDLDEENLKITSEFFEIPQTYQEYKDLVNDENVDVVYICAPTNRHMDMVKEAAKAKKQIFCEKPLAHSFIQATELLGVAIDADIKAAAGLVLRYDQFVLYAKKLIETHEFGLPMLAHIRDDQHFPVDYVYHSKWRGQKSQAGGGTLIEHSIHDIDLLRWLFGDVDEVYARVNNFSGREVEDHASVMMSHKSGCVSTLDSIWHWIDRPNERRIEFFFEKGYIGIALESGKRYLEYQLLDQAPIRIWHEQADVALLEYLGLHSKNNLSIDAVEALTCVGPERYAALSYAFLSTINTDINPTPNFKDAVAAHNIIDAAYESAEQNLPIVLL